MKQIIRYGLLILFPLLLGVGETEIVVDSGQEAENATWEKSAGAEYVAFSFLWENACGELTLDINHFTSSYKSYIWLAANRKDYRTAALVLCLFKESALTSFYADSTAYYVYRLCKIVV
ncbi:hypothetical protein [Odoribacter laneus]|uniref:hypothetical protein n=1 Tax=Odoribacter laneus TaxID=626933 RepID=UPI000337C96E|nr:hypothetical protein [Odoribacter laneus]CCZ80002.1 putative uncharacterized protein [Odoribacter laneus CAG:561]